MGHEDNCSKLIRPSFHLTKAALAAQRRPLQQFFRELTCCPRHARLVLLGQRQGSVKLLAAMRRALGEPGWAYATGATEVLRAAAPTAEAQPCR
jgi:hypothetical protein